MYMHIYLIKTVVILEDFRFINLFKEKYQMKNISNMIYNF